MTWKLLGQETPPTDKVVLIAEKTKMGYIYTVAQLFISDEGGKMNWDSCDSSSDPWPVSPQDRWMEIPEVPK